MDALNKVLEKIPSVSTFEPYAVVIGNFPNSAGSPEGQSENMPAAFIITSYISPVWLHSKRNELCALSLAIDKSFGSFNHFQEIFTETEFLSSVQGGSVFQQPLTAALSLKNLQIKTLPSLGG